MNTDEAIRSRRTWKCFTDEPLTREELEELFELARWAPNHKLTQPWRFRVVGPETRRRLCELVAEQAKGAVPESADPQKVADVAVKKLQRSPTIVAASYLRNPDPKLEPEDHAASAIAIYIMLLGATERGLAGFWRTPALLRTAEGLELLGIGPDEAALGLIHFGHCGDVPPKPGRRDDAETFVSWLD